MSTVAALFTSWRSQLDDEVEDYGWSNNTLMGYLNDLLVELCEEIPALIQDSTTASVCQVAVAISASALTLSSAILKVTRAKLSSQDDPLPFVSVAYMDAKFPGWESEANGEPTHLITEGVGNGKVRLYPPSNAVDTLNLTVNRLPIADLAWATDQDNPPDIPAKFHRRLANGILMKAYGKQDTDTYDEKKMRTHKALWEEDKEAIKRAMLFENRKNEKMVPRG